MKLRLVALFTAGMALAGCVSTQEVPLAPNVVRLDTQASGLLFQGQAGSATQRRAAELTLQNGYTHFRIEQASTGQGSELIGVQTSNNGNIVANPYTASYTGTTLSTPIYRRTSSVGVTVVMFHASEPGAQGAFDAAEVLARMKG